MAFNNFKIKDNGQVIETIDFREKVFTGLDLGEHEIVIEGYFDNDLITSISKNITITSSTLDPDYEAVINFAQANSIPIPDAAQQQADNNLIIELKNSGRWDREDVFFNFSGTATSAFKLICWKRLVKATEYGSLTWSEDGVEGNGFNGYINTHFDMSNAVQATPSNGGIYAYINNAPVGNQAITGQYNSSSSYVLWLIQTGAGQGNFAFGSNKEVSYNGYAIGLNGFGKYGSGDSSSTVFTPSVNNGANIPSGTFPTGEIPILAREVEGTMYSYSTHSIKYFGIGADLTPDWNNLKTILT